MHLFSRPAPDALSAYFNQEQPLGPVDASSIADLEIAAYLLSPENQAVADMANGASILLGRRGAGKSSLINGFSLGKHLKSHLNPFYAPNADDSLFKRASDFERDHLFRIRVNFPEEMNLVLEEFAKKHLRGPEIAAKLWEERFWILVLQRACGSEFVLTHADAELRAELRRLHRFVADGGDEFLQQDFFRLALSAPDALSALPMTLTKLRMLFARMKQSILFLIDSMDDYDLQGNENVRIGLSGLIHLIAQGGKGRTVFLYKLALPLEVFQTLRNAVNFERHQVALARLTWKPVELMRIAANRLLICHFLLAKPVFEDWTNQFGTMIATDRATLQKFLRTMFEGGTQNEVFHREPTTNYVLRHTQLLPRQVINLLSEILKASKSVTGRYHTIESGSFDEAVLRACDAIVNGVVHGYQHVYPRLLEVFEHFLPRCPVQITYGDMHHLFNRSPVRAIQEEYTQDFHAFVAAMLTIGAFGLRSEETSMYIMGEFQYCTDIGSMPSERSMFLMHPAFSRRYLSTEGRRAPGKAVLPRGSLLDVA